MLVPSLVVIGSAAVAALIASAVAALSRVLTGSNGLSRALGTLVIPSLIVGALVYWLITMEVDDAPPGMLIMGNLTLLAVVTPITFLASHFTVQFLARRASRIDS
jgi:hypothetical protein